jgi:hypothetical protein
VAGLSLYEGFQRAYPRHHHRHTHVW